MTKSLLCVQGPIQLISALCAFYYLCEEEKKQKELYICFFDLHGDENDTFNILRSFVQEEVSDVFFISQKQINKMYFCGKILATKKLRKLLKHIVFDELYLAYMESFSQCLFGTTYKKARKICCGDGLGTVGWKKLFVQTNSCSSRGKISLRNFVRKMLSEFSNKDLTFERQVLILPARFDTSDEQVKSIPLCIPPKEFVRSVIHRYLMKADSLKEIIPTGKYCIVLPNNLSQAGWVSEENELLLYDELFNSISGEYTIIIKPHPRMPKSFFCNPFFKKKNIVCLISPEYSRLPIEFFERLVSQASFITTFFSSSLVNLKYLYDINVNQFLTENLIDRYFYPEKKERGVGILNLNLSSLAGLKDWDGKSWLN